MTHLHAKFLLAMTSLVAMATDNNRAQAAMTQTQLEQMIIDQGITLTQLNTAGEDLLEDINDIEQCFSYGIASGKTFCTLSKKQGSVAFTAYLDSVQSYTGSNRIIKFNQVPVNRGGGYSASTGIFKAPMDGYYRFSMFISGKAGTVADVALVKAGTKLITANVDAVFQNEQSAGNEAIVPLAQDDQISVRWLGSSSNTWSNAAIFKTCTFSGVLLDTP